MEPFIFSTSNLIRSSFNKYGQVLFDFRAFSDNTLSKFTHINFDSSESNQPLWRIGKVPFDKKTLKCGIRGIVRKRIKLDENNSEAIVIDTPFGQVVICKYQLLALESTAEVLKTGYGIARSNYSQSTWRCVRHWWSIPDVQKNYSIFAKIRSAFYSEWFSHDIKRLPSSTCVSLPNINGAILMFLDPSEGVSCHEGNIPATVPKPKAYGFEYERTIYISKNGIRTLFVSATAGTNHVGQLLVNSSINQFKLAMDHINQLAGANGCNISDAKIITVYANKTTVNELDNSSIREHDDFQYPCGINFVFADLCRSDIKLEVEAVFSR